MEIIHQELLDCIEGIDQAKTSAAPSCPENQTQFQPAMSVEVDRMFDHYRATTSSLDPGLVLPYKALSSLEPCYLAEHLLLTQSTHPVRPSQAGQLRERGLENSDQKSSLLGGSPAIVECSPTQNPPSPFTVNF